MNLIRNILFRLAFRIAITFAIGYYSTARAQPSKVDEQKYEINRIEFRGNKSFKPDILNELVLSKETPSGFSQFMYRTIGEKLGSKPEYFAPEIFNEDIRRLELFYQNNGYHHSIISGSTVLDSVEHRVDLIFSIVENRQSYVDSVLYVGLEELHPDIRSKILAEPMIKKGVPLIEDRASGEIRRVLNILSDNGFPTARFITEKSGKYEILSSGNFFLKYFFDIGRYYTFGEASVSVDPRREDIVNKLITRHLDFKHGDMYSREKIMSSERNLNRLGLFESARIDHPYISDTASSNVVPIEIYVRPKTRNELSPEFIVSDEGGFFNLGIGIGYVNRNFLGDARTFNTHMRIRTQDIQRWDFDRVFKGNGLRDFSVRGTIELQFQVIQPYLLTRTLSASWTSTLSAEKQQTYILSILRNKIGFSNQFARYTYGFFDWTLERVSPEILQDTIETQSVLNVLRQEDQPQFNSILTLTLQRDKTNDIFAPTDGFFNSISIEESGILPKLLPGIRAGLPFTQYYKMTLLGRWYKDLTWRRFNILAWKLKSGYQNKYGESRRSSVSIPLNRRYFAGGSGSVRGWNARELGAMPKELIQFGGNFIFEGSIEMRISHFQGHSDLWFIKLENILGIYFLDFGNSWADILDFRFKDFAVAAGIGLRYETFFGPFRIDYGFRVYDPSADNGRNTIFQKRFFNEVLSRGVFHFGIGHAF
ncbi:MAG: BamA/TamA family outer membrane protein [Ignavibacteriales bacterium]|nr:BamA/TamA family outer membrane protein [Ignavibacteriales bacterium]